MTATLSRPAAPEGSKFRVLVVEDEPDIARVILMTLTAAGFECRHAAEGESGLKAFHEDNPHLIVLDMMMPGLSGRDVCLQMRQQSLAPIVIMTALETDADQMDGFKMGADDYITKPFNPKLMAARVASNLRRAYRYDALPPGAGEADFETVTGSSTMLNAAGLAGQAIAPTQTPAGWATCDSCSYMGPRARFEKEDALGRPGMICPNCKQSEYIVFSLG